MSKEVIADKLLNPRKKLSELRAEKEILKRVKLFNEFHQDLFTNFHETHPNLETFLSLLAIGAAHLEDYQKHQNIRYTLNMYCVMSHYLYVLLWQLEKTKINTKKGLDPLASLVSFPFKTHTISFFKTIHSLGFETWFNFMFENKNKINYPNKQIIHEALGDISNLSQFVLQKDGEQLIKKIESAPLVNIN